MVNTRASFFSSPDTVMRSHLSGDELHLVNTRDPSVSWRSPSVLAFVIGHWIQSLLVVGAVLVAAVVFVFGLGPTGFRFVLGGIVCLVLAVELAVLEVRLFFRTYLRYIITPTRIIRMDGNHRAAELLDRVEQHHRHLRSPRRARAVLRLRQHRHRDRERELQVR